MIKEAEIKEMPLREKLRLMEFIWDDISNNESGYEIPDWHKQVLSETEIRYQKGLEEPIDWELAKEMLRNGRNEV